MAAREKVVPELGFMGWITDPLKKLDILFAHAVLTDYSQSTVFRNKVTSIPYIIAQYHNMPLELQGELQIKLQAYFSRYFDTVSVQCKSQPADQDNRYTVSLSIAVQDKGNFYELVNVLVLENGKVASVLKEVNK